MAGRWLGVARLGCGWPGVCVSTHTLGHVYARVCVCVCVQASSPDEEALVTGAAFLGYRLFSRSTDKVRRRACTVRHTCACVHVCVWGVRVRSHVCKPGGGVGVCHARSCARVVRARSPASPWEHRAVPNTPTHACRWHTRFVSYTPTGGDRAASHGRVPGVSGALRLLVAPCL
jgi:hypothetical protein